MGLWLAPGEWTNGHKVGEEIRQGNQQGWLIDAPGKCSAYCWDLSLGIRGEKSTALRVRESARPRQAPFSSRPSADRAVGVSGSGAAGGSITQQVTGVNMCSAAAFAFPHRPSTNVTLVTLLMWRTSASLPMTSMWSAQEETTAGCTRLIWLAPRGGSASWGVLWARLCQGHRKGLIWNNKNEISQVFREKPRISYHILLLAFSTNFGRPVSPLRLSWDWLSSGSMTAKHCWGARGTG